MSQTPERRPSAPCVALLCAVVTSLAALAVQLIHSLDSTPGTEEAVVTLRVAAAVVWSWFFTAYVIERIDRRFDALDRRLAEIEDAGRRDGYRDLDIDPDVVDSARLVAKRLLRGS